MYSSFLRVKRGAFTRTIELGPGMAAEIAQRVRAHYDTLGQRLTELEGHYISILEGHAKSKTPASSSDIGGALEYFARMGLVNRPVSE